MKYCPTFLILADYFTKPLQESLFKLFREIIMGYKHISVLLDQILSKERVGRTYQKKSEIVSSTNDQKEGKRILKIKSYKDILVGDTTSSIT